MSSGGSEISRTRCRLSGRSCGTLLGEMFEACMDVLTVERMGRGVAALEVESLVGDKDLARSAKVN